MDIAESSTYLGIQGMCPGLLVLVMPLAWPLLYQAQSTVGVFIHWLSLQKNIMDIVDKLVYSNFFTKCYIHEALIGCDD